MALGEARVEIVADLSSFERTLQTGVSNALTALTKAVDKSMKQLASSARGAGAEISDALSDGARKAKDDLTKISTDDTFDKIEAAAQQAGEQVEQAFAEASRGVTEDLRDIGAGNAFTGIDADAQRVGEQIKQAFAEASRGVVEDLRDISAGDPFGQIDQDVERAAAQIEAAFARASRGAQEDLADIDDGQPFAGVERDAERAGESIERSFREAARSSERALDGIGGRFRGVAAGIAGALAGIGLGAGFGYAIQQASSLGESVNAVRVTFGEAAEGILALSETASTSLGLTATDFNSLAVRFSAFATAVAGDGGSVIEVMQELTGRAADFASVMNLEVNEAAQLFQSGLAGETEPLRRFGLDLSAASVEAYALAEGIAAPGEAMTDQQKVIARYGLLMQQTATTAGDFSNTSDSLANSMRILKAQAQEAAGVFGAALLPGLEGLVNAARDMVTNLEEPLSRLGTVVGEAMGPLFDAIGPALEAVLGIVVELVADVSVVLGSLAPLIAPVVQIFGALATTLSGVVARAFEALAPSIEMVARVLGEIGEIVGPVLEEVGGLIGDVLVGAIELLAPLLADIVPLFRDMARVVGGAIRQALPDISAAFGRIKTALEPVIPILGEFVKSVVQALLPQMPRLVDASLKLALAFTDLFVAMVPLLEPLATLAVFIVDYGLAPAMQMVAFQVQAVAAVVSFAVDQFQRFNGVVEFLVGMVPGGAAALQVLQGALDVSGYAAVETGNAMANASTQALAHIESLGAVANASSNASTQSLNHLAALQQIGGYLPTLDTVLSDAGIAMADFETVTGDAATTAAAIVETELERVEQAAKDLEQTVATAAQSAAQSFLDLSEEGKSSVESFVNETIADTARLSEFQTNVTTIASQTSGEFATYLLSMGESGEDLVADLADPAKAQELQTAFNAWVDKTRVESRNMANEFATVDPAFRKTLQGVAGLTVVEMVIIEANARQGAYKVAQGMMQGMSNGIAFYSPQVQSAIRTAVQDAINAAKAQAGVKSPSTVTRDEIGKPMVQGILKGITEDGRLIELALVSAVLEPISAMRAESDNLTRVTTKTGRQFVIQYRAANAAVQNTNQTITQSTAAVEDFRVQSTNTIKSWADQLKDETRSWGTEFEIVVDKMVQYAETKFTGLANTISRQMGGAFTSLTNSAQTTGASISDSISEAADRPTAVVEAAATAPAPAAFDPSSFTSLADIVAYATQLIAAAGPDRPGVPPRTPPGLQGMFDTLTITPVPALNPSSVPPRTPSGVSISAPIRGKEGPAVSIQNATFVTPMDAEMVAQKVNAAERARMFAG